MLRTRLLIAHASLLVAAGCHDQPRIAQGPTGSDLTSLPHLQHQLRPSETEVGASARATWDRLSPEQQAAGLRTVEQVYASRGEAYFRPQLAVVPGNLPGGAHALVIRDPSAPGQPLIVVSRATLHVHALFLAHAALREDARRQPGTVGRRRLNVFPDGSVVAGTAGTPERFSVRVPPMDAGRQDLLGQLTRSATSVTAAHIPEVGPATLLRFE